MRINRDYALDLITKLGTAVAKKAASNPNLKWDQQSVAATLRKLQREVQYKGVTASEAVRQLHEIAEHTGLVDTDWKDFMRSLAV